MKPNFFGWKGFQMGHVVDLGGRIWGAGREEGGGRLGSGFFPALECADDFVAEVR